MPESKTRQLGSEKRYGVVDDLVGSSTQLRVLETLLNTAWFPSHRKWLIDNSKLGEVLAQPGLARLIALMRWHRAKLTDLAVAWVTPEPCGLPRQLLERQLPFQFRRFDKVADAERWLLSRP